MIDRNAIEQIIAQYTKHGWILRRVLLSGSGPDSTPDASGLFNGVEIRPSEIDGLWFSRSSRPEVTAWELRHLSQNPYALVENIADGMTRDKAELVLKQAETKMIAAVHGQKPGH